MHQIAARIRQTTRTETCFLRSKLLHLEAADCYRKAGYLNPEHDDALTRLAALAHVARNAGAARICASRAQRILQRTTPPAGCACEPAADVHEPRRLQEAATDPAQL